MAQMFYSINGFSLALHLVVLAFAYIVRISKRTWHIIIKR
jgi:hypothetical protein